MGSKIKTAIQMGRLPTSPRTASHAAHTASASHIGARISNPITLRVSKLQSISSKRWPRNIPATNAKGTVMLTNSHGIFSAATVYSNSVAITHAANARPIPP